MTAVTFRPGEEEAVPPSRSRRGFMLPTLPSKLGKRETAALPRARLRSGGFPDGWERSAPHSYKTPRTAPEAGTKARCRPTLMRTWGQLPRRTIPSRGPEKTRTAAAIPAAGRQDSPPFRRPQTPRTAPRLCRRSSGNAPPPRKAPASAAGLPSAALPPPPENANCACRFSPGPRVPPFTVAAARFLPFKNKTPKGRKRKPSPFRCFLKKKKT